MTVNVPQRRGDYRPKMGSIHDVSVITASDGYTIAAFKSECGMRAMELLRERNLRHAHIQHFTWNQYGPRKAAEQTVSR